MVVDWRPGSCPDLARRRADAIARIRAYFTQQSVLEVWTPALSEPVASSPALVPLNASDGTSRWALHTSPEHAMKRLLAAGYPDIYQICRVFRGAESGRLHSPEFSMVEWYRLGFSLQQMIADTVAVVRLLLSNCDIGREQIVSYRDTLQTTFGIDIRSASVALLADALDADDRLRQTVGQNIQPWLDLAMTRAAEAFPEDKITVVTHYPAEQAALARLCPEDPTVAERFEVFVGSVELANGFVELTDAAEQRQRFEQDREAIAAQGGSAPPVDENLLAALEDGLPDCAGVALGLDRALMINEGSADIRAVMSFVPN